MNLTKCWLSMNSFLMARACMSSQTRFNFWLANLVHLTKLPRMRSFTLRRWQRLQLLKQSNLRPRQVWQWSIRHTLKKRSVSRKPLTTFFIQVNSRNSAKFSFSWVITRRRWLLRHQFRSSTGRSWLRDTPRFWLNSAVLKRLLQL